MPEGRRRGLYEDADGVPALVAGDQVIAGAPLLAERLLGRMRARWEHTCGVVSRALELAPAVAAPDRPLFVAAAWLHDIGYAEQLRQTGFHPLDGACYLERSGWGHVLAGLVAHHSGAHYVAAARGLGVELSVFSDPDSWAGPVADALTTADQTTGPDGRPVELETRLADMLRRHGPDSPQAQVHHLRAPVIRAAVARTEQRLHAPLAEALGGGGEVAVRGQNPNISHAWWLTQSG